MSLRIIFYILLISLPITALAYEDDYIWQDKYNKQLPKAEKGEPKAQYAIGTMYERGKGVLMNPSTAFEWYAKAAQQGHDKAAFKVGFSFLRGKGVNKNFGKALKWLKIAATKNNVRAYFFLGTMYEKGSGVTKNIDKSLSWYKKALNGGFHLAQERIDAVAAIQAKSKPPAENKPSTPDTAAVPDAPKPESATKETAILNNNIKDASLSYPADKQ